MKLKVCGITRVEDAIMARSLGADMVGVIGIAGTPRAIRAEEMQMIRQCIKDGLVFVTDSISHAESVAGRVDIVQVHRIMNEQEMRRLKGTVIAYVPANDFGTGYIEVVRKHGFTPLIHSVNGRLSSQDLIKFGDISDSGIAGGIGVDNAAGFIKSGAMFMDISSGVEDSPGVKSPWKIRRIAGMIK